MNAALKNQVERVILLSTDKAVYPINAMGQSKAMMEKLMISKSRQLDNEDTIFSATRYGNVMASRGSVIPLFVSQIKKHQPITITDPSMTRYLMSLQESIDLVLYAFENGEQGDIFVQKAPASTVEDLAETLKELFKSDVDIRIIGTRHGEKLYETLVSREEMAKAHDMGNYFRIPSDNRSLNYSKFFTDGEELITETNDYTSHNTKRLNKEELKNILVQLDFLKGEFNA